MFLNALMVLYISVTGGQDVRGRALVVGLVRIRALQSTPIYGYLCIFQFASSNASSSFFWKVVVLQDGLLLLSLFTYLLVGADLDESGPR